GAFTGAQRLRKGRFELADGGTIFLDEVGEMSPEIQVKLLRVLQNREFERVGGTHTLKVDVRVITATNHVLLDEVAAGHFRPDLFYRLNVYPITVPPLRKRRDDIPLLVEFFVREISTRMGKKIDRIAPGVLEQFKAYDWPGNVRELMNVVERAIIVSQDAILRLPQGALGNTVPSALDVPQSGSDCFTSLEDHERQYILRALETTGWRVSGSKGAARVLGVNPSTLESKIKKLGIKKDASTHDPHRK
ncbi:MAG: sigma 54-interacting transcriptional regulator, partial [Syntrophobacter sp.]